MKKKNPRNSEHVCVHIQNHSETLKKKQQQKAQLFDFEKYAIQ